MVEPGGLRDITTVKFAALYALHFWSVPASYGTLSEILLYDELIDFFDFSVALDELQKTNHVKVNIQPNDRLFTLTPLGREAIGLFQDRIPLSVREKIVKTAKRLQKDLDFSFEVNARVETENGSFFVFLSMKEKGAEVFSLKIGAASREMAETMAENFRKNPGYAHFEIAKILYS